jgi:hypothetical protein
MQGRPIAVPVKDLIQLLHLYLWVPLLVKPIRRVAIDWQVGQLIDIFDID